MSKSRLDEVVEALESLGGEGAIDAIYAAVLERGKIDIKLRPHWKEQVRNILQEHSSDAKYFYTQHKKEEDDIFCAPRGIRAGYWTIRGTYRDVLKDAVAREVEEGNDIRGYEGGNKQRYVNIYERDKKLRAAAIRIHGTTCKGCGFNFEDTYGSIGQGYIEVHHLISISTLGGNVQINPNLDMTVLCSNCHRIVHHNQDHVLSLAELQTIVFKHKI